MSITPKDVKLQLMSTLPRHTEEYGDNVLASALVESGAIKVTSAAHGLVDQALIVASDVKVVLQVTGVTYDAGTGEATITVDAEHDRTSISGEATEYNIATLSGFADSTYNGEFVIVSATRTTFNIEAEADAVGALGHLTEDRGLYLGFNQITVLDADTFTVPNQDNIPDGTVLSTFNYVSDQRIFIAADITRAVTRWAQKADRKPSLFVIFGEETASKDRHTTNDAVLAATSQNTLHMKYVPTVTLMTMAATPTEQLAATKQQQVYEELRPATRKAMYGHRFESDENSVIFAAIESGNSPQPFNQNNYIHSFDYQIPYEITIEQGDDYRRNVSFRQVILESKMFTNEGDEIIADAELEI